MVRHQTLTVTGETQLLGEVSMSTVPQAIQEFVRNGAEQSQLMQSIKELERRIETLEAKTGGVEPRVTALEAKSGAMQPRLHRVEAYVNAVEPRVSALEVKPA